MPSDPRDFDIVLLGATGFTGGLISVATPTTTPA